MLLEQVPKRLIGQFLQRFQAVERELVQCVPSLAVELDPAAD
jgi:hypothetical protein